MMSSFLPYIILYCMLYKTVVTQVSVSSNEYPTNGATITLTCSITNFILPSSWINDTSSGVLSICLPAGTCSPSTSGRYSYSATSSTIVVQISAFDATIDDFGWKCRHNTDTYVFKSTFATIPSSSPPTSAIPTVTLTASSSPYFDIGGSISLTCSINEDVNVNSAHLRKGSEPYVWIQIKSPSYCELTPMTGRDPHNYSVTCEQRMTVHIVMNGTVATDHNATWSCQMSAVSGICKTQSCISTSSVTTALRVPVSSIQLRDGNGQPLVTPLAVLDGSSKVFQCDTSPDGSRPRAFFNWYKRSENQSPILIQGQSVSTPGPKPEVDLSISISYSTLTLMGNRSYQNMYIYCEARDETNRGNFLKSTEAQINIVYPPEVQLYPNTSVFNVTEGLLKFVFTCNVTDANPMPDDYSWFHGSNVIQGQTRSSYELLNAQKSHDGMYQCMGRNNYGTGNSSTMYLNVQYGAEIINISVVEGNTVSENATATLRCLVDSNPKSNITWTKQGTMGVLQTNLYVHESQLIIENAECLDTSNYTCNARNGVGQPVERKTPLYVTCHPRTDFRSPSVTTVYSKRYGIASLNYTVISFPESIFNWTFIGNGSETRSLPDSATKHDSRLQSVLIFTNLSITDFGFYKVIAKNVFPTSATEVFQLIPANVPDIPSSVTVTDVNQTSFTVQWLAGYNGGLKQTFHIMIKDSDIMRSVYAPDPGYGKSGTQKIEDLIPNTEYGISMSASNSLGSSSVTNVIILTTLKEGTPANLGIPVAGIAGGVSAGFVLILVMGLSIFLWRRSQQKKQNEDENDAMREHKERSVGHDSASGQDYEGLHLTTGEASPYLHTNGKRWNQCISPEITCDEGHYNHDKHGYFTLNITYCPTDLSKINL